MFHGLLAIAFKEALHVLRDPATRFVFLIPVIQLTVFGYAIGIDVHDVPLVVVDLDETPESRELIDLVEHTDALQVVGHHPSTESAEREMLGGRARVVLVIDDGFARALHRGESVAVEAIVDGSYSTEATAALATLRAVGSGAAPALLRRPPPQGAAVDMRGRLLFNPELRSATFFVPGLVGIILQLVTVMLTAFSIVRERELGTYEQLMVTPVGAWGLLLGKLLPYMAIAMIETALVLILMVHVFAVPIRGSLPLLLVLTALFVLTALALGVIISTAARTQAEAMQATFLILLPSILLSGFVFPLQTIPETIRPLTLLIPVRYFIEILRAIIVRGGPFAEVWEQALALGIYTLVLLVVGALRFRKRLD